MPESEATRQALAASAAEEQILSLLHDTSPQVIRVLLDNRNLRESDVLVLANRRNLPADVLDAIARDQRWAKSYAIRLALATNPKTPLSVSLSIVRYLRLFDIARMTLNPHLPLAFRHKVEAIIMERIPTMPLGLKKTLAKMSSGNVLLRLLQDPEGDVIALCLNNPRLQESHLFKTINRRDTIAQTIRMIAEHRRWSIRSLIRYSLVRNEHMPLARTEEFLRTMKLLDLKELYADPKLPDAVKPLVYREQLSRGLDPGKEWQEQIFEVNEDDDRGLESFEPEDDENNETGTAE